MELFVGLNEGEKEVGLRSSVAGGSEAGNGEVNVETLAVFPSSRKDGGASDREFRRRDGLRGKAVSDIEQSRNVRRKRKRWHSGG